ncbi:MAG: DNA polymerase III subunit delta [Sandaracinaceae bacterium]|nr:DNA polymerase III subunit delta [Sandaracinaceae bacterium]
MTEELDIQTFLAEARQGRWRPVNVLVGAETLLIERAARYLKKACVGDDGVRGFNDDLFHGQGLVGAKVVAAARTLPMMAKTRYVLVRDLEAVAASELDVLAEYLAKPSPSTCLVLTGDKLLGTTKLAKAAKSLANKGDGAFLAVEPLKGALLERFVLGEVKRRRCTIDADAQALLVDAVGNDLAAMEDAIERLSLFVSQGDKPGQITRHAVEEVVQRVRVDTIWKLVDAIALKRQKLAMEAVGSLLADREQPLGILGQIARQLRIVSRMKDALDEGLRPDDAVKRAGAPPFKARDLSESARKFSRPDLRRAFRVLAETDQALKGSKRDPETLLEESVLALTR